MSSCDEIIFTLEECTEEIIFRYASTVEEVVWWLADAQGEPGPPGTTSFSGITDSPRDNAALAAELEALDDHTHEIEEVNGLTEALSDGGSGWLSWARR